MKQIQGSLEPLGDISFKDENKTVRNIETACRNCYQSPSAQTLTEAKAFITKITARGHLSVAEHSQIVFRVSSEVFTETVMDLVARNRHPYFNFALEEKEYFIAGNVRSWIEYLRTGSVVALGYYNVPLKLAAPLFFKEYDNDFSRKGEVTIQRFDHIPFSLRRFAFFVTCDRGIMAEFTRHRALSFSVMSTRYCRFDENAEFIRPSELTDPKAVSEWEMACMTGIDQYLYLTSKGAKAQTARSVLNNSLVTHMYVSGLFEGWRNFIHLRDDKAAHPEIQPFGKAVKKYFSDYHVQFLD